MPHDWFWGNDEPCDKKGKDKKFNIMCCYIEVLNCYTKPKLVTNFIFDLLVSFENAMKNQTFTTKEKHKLT